jgi:hypothetical protein
MIRFVGGTVGGVAVTTYHDVRVHIRHELKEGYIPSANGDMIREEIPLREFLGRIFKEGREVENELYRISKCMAGGYGYNDNELDRVTNTYDVMYSNLIRRGKIVLAQHKIRTDSMIGGRDPYDLERRQLMANQSDDYRRQAMMQQMSTPPLHYQPHGLLGLGGNTQIEQAIKDEAERSEKEKKKRTDDLFFLTT